MSEDRVSTGKTGIESKVGKLGGHEGVLVFVLLSAGRPLPELSRWGVVVTCNTCRSV